MWGSPVGDGAIRVRTRLGTDTSCWDKETDGDLDDMTNYSVLGAWDSAVYFSFGGAAPPSAGCRGKRLVLPQALIPQESRQVRPSAYDETR